MPNINDYETDMIGTVTDKEVEAKLNKLTNRKVPGPDYIPNEFSKNGSLKFVRKISQLFNKILNETETPEE